MPEAPAPKHPYGAAAPTPGRLPPQSAGFLPSEQLVREMAKITDTVMLSFSCGKDSVAAWLALRGHFKRIVPYYLYLVPDLEFVERSLRYFEGVMGTHIIRLPNPALMRQLNALMFQPPHRIGVIEALDLPEPERAEVEEWLCESLGMDYHASWFALGVRASDSTIRALHFKTHGAITLERRIFYPVWDWNKQRVVDEIRASGVRLPVDYKLFGRSFDGINLQYLLAIREHFPSDYQRILEWYPLAELELYRLQFAQDEKKRQAADAAAGITHSPRTQEIRR